MIQKQRNKSLQNGTKKDIDRSVSLNTANFEFLKGKTVLVTGGTGSFGRRFVDILLQKAKIRRLIVFSRDELKQYEMSASIQDDRLRFFLGDIRDLQRLQRAFHGVDYVVHAAALKQVPTLEYNPFEAVLTNIIGGQNVINAAIDQEVKRVVFLSTDKAVNPINLYGATKLCAEKLFVAGNAYAAAHNTRFSVVRYGNVVGSRGSVVPLFQKYRSTGVFPLTDARMTRFWLTLTQGVHLVIQALESMHGGEIFVPKIASMRITDLAKAIGPDCKFKVIGIRPGEKIHETLLTEHEAAQALDAGHFYVIQPNFPWWGDGKWESGKPLPKNFNYTSDTNNSWLAPSDLRSMLDSAGNGSSRRLEAIKS